MSDETLPVCLSGLQGLPVQVTGWTGYQEKESLVIPNHIHFQLAPAGQSLQSSTFFMNGTQYFVASAGFVEPKQEGLADFSQKPFAEYHIWGKPTATQQSSTFALLVIPFYETYQETDVQKQLQAAPSAFQSYIPQGESVRILTYSTCLERKSGTTTLSVAYWATGAGVTADFRKTNGQTLMTPGKYGIPASILDNNPVLSSYQQYNDERKTKGRREYKIDQGVSIPYFTTILLSTTTTEFQKSFRMIKGFSIKQVTSAGKDINSYRCIRVDRQKDIKDGKLLIDPVTGKTLREETEEADAEFNASMEAPEDTGSKKAYLTVLIVLGIILGIAGIALIIYGIQFLLGTRELTNQPAVPKEVLAAAALSQNSPLA